MRHNEVDILSIKDIEGWLRVGLYLGCEMGELSTVYCGCERDFWIGPRMRASMQRSLVGRRLYQNGIDRLLCVICGSL